jgi:hypothetical protein
MYTIKANPTAGVANCIDSTLSNILDATIANNEGYMLVRGVSGWESLPPGPAGYVLTSAGVSSVPVFSASASGNSLNSITDATNTNTISNGNYPQTWSWPAATSISPMTLSATSLSSGSLLTLTTGSDATALSVSGGISSNVGSTTKNTPINITGTISNYFETKVKNTSADTACQSGFTAERNDGSATTGFAWMGINGSAFNNPQTYNAGAAGDATFVGAGNDLILANASQSNPIKFQTGKAASPFFDTRMTILNSGNVGIGTITPTSTLDVVGGLGLGFVNIGISNYIILPTDSTIYLSLSTAQTLNWPSASAFSRRIITIVNIGNFTKTTSTSYYALAGALSSKIPPYGYVTVQSDGTSWRAISSNFQTMKAQFKMTGSSTSVPSGANTQLAFTTLNYDTCNNTTGINTFVAPSQGLYSFSACGSVTPSGLSGESYIEIFNVTNNDSLRAPICGNGSYVSGTITCNMMLSAADQVVVRLRQNSGTTYSVVATSALNWFCGHGPI